ncbi:MAG: hypothetical protein ACT4PL_11670 [Phycisphaerales bacterium]
MPPLGPYDYILLIVLAITLFELVVELKAKRWVRAIVAALFCGIFVYIGRNIFIWVGHNWLGIP